MRTTPRCIYYSRLSDTFWIAGATKTLDEDLIVVGYLEVEKGAQISLGIGSSCNGSWSDVKNIYERPEVRYVRFFEGRLNGLGIDV